MIIDEQDFDMITTTSMEWGAHWIDQAPRFEMMEGEVIDFAWAMGYWVGDYTAVILAKNYLLQQDEEFQVYIDTITDDFLIVTDYRTKGWRKPHQLSEEYTNLLDAAFKKHGVK